jgi:hypothetical protein
MEFESRYIESLLFIKFEVVLIIVARLFSG